MSRACLDAGVISLYYQKDPPKDILDLMRKIKAGKILATVPNVVLVEVFKHLCVAGGKDYAAGSIRSFKHKISPQLMHLTPELILDAGLLKCQFRTKLSYNDSIVIATALKEKATLHTTEKNFPKIRNLKIFTYDF
ncbi:MAG: PIN domain-containing protein [Candidatus Helarchaeota archaeon]|nr:PIN domain-containing protein [Candidatus Helarchaeota archaeon]